MTTKIWEIINKINFRPNQCSETDGLQFLCIVTGLCDGEILQCFQKLLHVTQLRLLSRQRKLNQ